MKLATKCLKNCAKFIKEVFNPTDFYSSQRFMFFVFLMYGLIPYKLVGKQGNQTLQIAKFGFVVAILYILVFSYSFVRTLMSRQIFIDSVSVSVFGGILNLIVSFVSTVPVYINSLCVRRKVKTFFEIVPRIDKELMELGIELNHKRAFMFNIKCFTYMGTVYALYVIGCLTFLPRVEEGPGFAVRIILLLPYLIITILIFNFINFARTIYIRFGAMNNILLSTVSESQSEAINDFNINHFTTNPMKESFKESHLSSNTLVDLLKRTCSIHDDLCDTCFIVEEYFGLKMLIIVSVGFLIIIFNGYYLMEIATGNFPGEDKGTFIKFSMFVIFQIVISALGIVCIIQSSCAISNENEKCSIYVHKIMKMTGDEFVKEKLMEFSQQLIHRKVRFTALNLFPLDRTLIFTIVGAVTTYLIILFQFSNHNTCMNLNNFRATLDYTTLQD